MFVCDRRGISCLNRQCERYHVARGGQLTLYGSGLSLRLRVYVTVPGGRERMCENEPNYDLRSETCYADGMPQESTHDGE